MEIVPGSGEIQTKAAFGDVQLHLEWATPKPPSGIGQDRGNSGIFFMGLVRAASPGFLPRQYLHRRTGRRDLWPVSSDL